jgi:hypothetical protein
MFTSASGSRLLQATANGTGDEGRGRYTCPDAVVNPVFPGSVRGAPSAGSVGGADASAPRDERAGPRRRAPNVRVDSMPTKRGRAPAARAISRIVRLRGGACRRTRTLMEIRR